MSDADNLLLTQIAQGDQKAFARFYDLYHSAVYRFALKRLREPSDAAEVLNQVMLEVWRTAARFEGRSQMLTWVLGIAHHKIIDAIRRTSRHEGEEVSPDWEDESQISAVDAVQLTQNSEWVRRCLERLSSAHREVVHLAFYEDLPYTEIALIVGCPEGTVKTRVFHAKNALKNCLKTLLGAEIYTSVTS